MSNDKIGRHSAVLAGKKHWLPPELKEPALALHPLVVKMQTGQSWVYKSIVLWSITTEPYEMMSTKKKQNVRSSKLPLQLWSIEG